MIMFTIPIIIFIMMTMIFILTSSPTETARCSKSRKDKVTTMGIMMIVNIISIEMMMMMN